MKSICVFCGSNPGDKPVYRKTAAALGRKLAALGLKLIYGGGNVGLMGIVADAALQAGAPVVGVIPESLMQKEVGHRGLSELHVVQTMHQRKMMMAERSDSFLGRRKHAGCCGCPSPDPPQLGPSPLGPQPRAEFVEHCESLRQ
jgi:uncharacterized protein (TIGR00730 family)